MHFALVVSIVVWAATSSPVQFAAEPATAGSVAATVAPLAAGSPPAKIDSFEGPYRFLSNFWPAEVVFENFAYPSVEHAYQSAKTLSMEDRRRIANLPTPAEAKAEGRKMALRPDWEKVKFQVMEDCVRYKFTHHPDLRAALLATGEAELVEGNDWGDRIWGVYQGEGGNRLGKILMKIRGELRVGATIDRG